MLKLTLEVFLLTLYLNKDEGEQDEEFKPLFQQCRHDCHSKGHVEVERVPGRTGMTLSETGSGFT